MVHKKFKILFEDRDNKVLDIDYSLNDTTLAVKWFSKIKHLSKIPIDEVESDLEDLSNLDLIYDEFCDFAGLNKMPLNQIRDQHVYNQLHKIFEDNHERLSNKSNNSILYKFHHAIHDAEPGQSKTRQKINIGWGIKEGPLTYNMNCNPFYEKCIKKNNLYLPWAELGKQPYKYWIDKEPADQTRFNSLCKPHVTFKAKFFVALFDMEQPKPFPNQFNQYFNQFRSQWFETYNIAKWTEKDEWCAPLLAYTNHDAELNNLHFKKIIV